MMKQYSSAYLEQIVPSVVSALASHGHDNVRLVCAAGDQVHTSAMVLAFLSPWLGELLKESQESAGETELCLVLPHADAGNVKVVLENLLRGEGQIDGTQFQKFYEIFVKVEIIDPLHVKHEVIDEEEEVKSSKTKLNFKKKSQQSPKFKRKYQPVTKTHKIEVCNYCGEEFTMYGARSEVEFKDHLKSHTVKNLSCECEFRRETDKEKSFHMKCFHLGHFGCEQCAKTFQLKGAYRDHIEWNHSEVMYMKNNIEVGETFASKEEVEDQIQLFSDTNFSPLRCGSSSVRKSKRHMSYKCPFGIFRKSQSAGIRQVTSRYVGCPVVLNINQQQDRSFVVSKAVLQHEEHEIGEECYGKYKKKLSKDQKEGVRAFLETGPSNHEVSLFLNDITGKQYSTSDAAFIVRRLKKEKYE